MIGKLKEWAMWVFDHPDFILSAFFMAIALIIWGQATFFLVIVSCHHLRHEYLKYKQSKSNEHLHNVICCVGHLVAKMDELGYEQEGQTIAKQYGLMMIKKKEVESEK